MKKRLLAILLTLAMVLVLFPAAALAAEDDFVIKDGVLVSYTGAGGAVTIPAGVTSIGDYAFYGGLRLTSVTIPAGVTSIGDAAFYSCTNLTSVTIPDSVTSIGQQAFMYCTKLTSVTVPAGVTSIIDKTFFGCSSLTSVTIPDSVTNIGEKAFYGCTALTDVTIPEGVTYIGGAAFFRTAWQKEQGDFVIANGMLLAYQGNGGAVTIPAGVASIVAYAFSGNESVTSVTIPAGVTSIGNEAFSYCSGLTSVTIPESVTRIPNLAFYRTGLTSVTIPNGVISIGSWAFFGCANLTSVAIPDSLTGIGPEAFEDCPALKDIYFGGSETQWKAFKLRDSDISGATIHYNSPMPEVPEQPTIPEQPAAPAFTDVPANEYYAQPVAWAVEKGITVGTTANTFSPDETCSRAQILTFLWRAKDKPEAAIANPFSDVNPADPTQYYVGAALWAYEQGLISESSFGADAPCTRGDVVLYLWRLAGRPKVEATGKFTDLPAGNAELITAVAWAAKNGITQGTTDTTFSPDDTCTRGQIMTFLHRAYAN